MAHSKHRLGLESPHYANKLLAGVRVYFRKHLQIRQTSIKQWETIENRFWILKNSQINPYQSWEFSCIRLFVSQKKGKAYEYATSASRSYSFTAPNLKSCFQPWKTLPQSKKCTKKVAREEHLKKKGFNAKEVLTVELHLSWTHKLLHTFPFMHTHSYTCIVIHSYT